MIIVSESAAALKCFIAKTSLHALAQVIVLRMALTFIMHLGIHSSLARHKLPCCV